MLTDSKNIEELLHALRFKSEVECIFCGHSELYERDYDGVGEYRWECKDCRKTFTLLSNTPLNQTKLDPSQLYTIFSLLSEGYAEWDINKKMGHSEVNKYQQIARLSSKIKSAIRGYSEASRTASVMGKHSFQSLRLALPEVQGNEIQYNPTEKRIYKTLYRIPYPVKFYEDPNSPDESPTTDDQFNLPNMLYIYITDGTFSDKGGEIFITDRTFPIWQRARAKKSKKREIKRILKNDYMWGKVQMIEIDYRMKDDKGTPKDFYVNHMRDTHVYRKTEQRIDDDESIEEPISEKKMLHEYVRAMVALKTESIFEDQILSNIHRSENDIDELSILYNELKYREFLYNFKRMDNEERTKVLLDLTVNRNTPKWKVGDPIFGEETPDS